ncbi:GNAT family N-acetyltransferase [Micropruina sonneratiae]|uniref:GNAT family N-acetyltransferase n=1 Tax=Micropruina sonneratiae TaxID=2986940 RepID=UPI0022266001|nr:GNAT family N-acetyltransferase [Micropruina sp. KQZ13P-5]MCW3158280.1 N-acetyltransferase [Micropruina sp. KQZ13P-5]
MSDPIVTDNPAAKRFEAHLDGELAGIAEYQLTDELMVFTHTEVEPAFEGRGVGSALARTALDHLRTEGTRKALAVCPFIKGWIQRHPEYLAITYGAAKPSAT